MLKILNKTLKKSKRSAIQFNPIYEIKKKFSPTDVKNCCIFGFCKSIKMLATFTEVTQKAVKLNSEFRPFLWDFEEAS